MAHHFEMIKEVGYFAEMNEAKIRFQSEPAEGDDLAIYLDPENRSFMINLFMHSADISNPIKPFESCQAWALLIIEEFFAQGIKEKEMGHEPMPMYQRKKTNRWAMQFNFIEFVVAPLYHSVTSIFPQLHSCATNLIDNQTSWLEKWKEDVQEDAMVWHYANSADGEEEKEGDSVALTVNEEKSESKNPTGTDIVAALQTQKEVYIDAREYSVPEALLEKRKTELAAFEGRLVKMKTKFKKQLSLAARSAP